MNWIKIWKNVSNKSKTKYSQRHIIIEYIESVSLVADTMNINNQIENIKKRTNVQNFRLHVIVKWNRLKVIYYYHDQQYHLVIIARSLLSQNVVYFAIIFVTSCSVYCDIISHSDIKPSFAVDSHINQKRTVYVERKLQNNTRTHVVSYLKNTILFCFNACLIICMCVWLNTWKHLPISLGQNAHKVNSHARHNAMNGAKQSGCVKKLFHFPSVK